MTETSPPSPPSAPAHPGPANLAIAQWLDHRLDASLGFHIPAARMYGIVVNDPSLLLDPTGQHHAARSSFLDERRDIYSMITGAAGVLARSFDAAAVVTVGWAAPMNDDGSMSHRPSRHPQRRRVRAIAVVDDDGVASVVRFEDDPDNPVAHPEAGVGAVVDALQTMWFGGPAALIEGLVNLRTTGGGCTRRP